jgi:hypothetical protein
MRITRAMLNARIERLNVILNRPATAWTRIPRNPKSLIPAERMVSNEGHFTLDSYAPGDGWVRYTLSMIVGENGGQINVSPSCTAVEMAIYLRGVFDVLDSVFMCDGGKHTFDKRKKSA